MSKKRILTLLVSLLMILMTPLTAFASIKDYSGGIDLDGMHYYDIGYTGAFDNQQELFKTALQKEGLDEYWNAAAYMAFANRLDTFGFSVTDTAHQKEQVGHICGKDKDDGWYLNTTWTDSGLNYAESMYSAYEHIEENIYSNYAAAKGSGLASRDSVVNKDLREAADTTIEPVLWKNTGYTVKSKNWEGHYVQFAVIFHNFRLTPVLTDDIGKGTTTVSGTPDSLIDTVSGYTNSSRENVQASQRLAKTRTESVENQINGTDTYTFSQNASISSSVSVSGLFVDAEVSTTFGIGAEQAFSSGWSDTVAKSQDFSSESEASVNMPAHTQLQLGQNAGTQVYSNTYDCPVAFSYDVTIAAYTWDPSMGAGAVKSRILASFDSSIGAAKDAREDFLRRRLRGYYDKDQIDWENGADKMAEAWQQPHGTTFGAFFMDRYLQKTLEGRAPMSVTGGKMTYSVEQSYTTIQDLNALYPLSSIRQDSQEPEYNMIVGDALVVDNIGLGGYNDKGVSYYGFQPRLGSWILVDENKTPIADSSVGYLETNGVTGTTKLVASDAGTLYLKYIIPEDMYNSAENLHAFATNETIDTTYIQVNVSSAPFNGTVEASGSVEGYAGEDINLDTAEGLSKRVLDENEVEIGNAPVEWVLQEANGASIINNVFIASEAGTYHIRALYQNQWSDEWIPVTISPARELAWVELSDDQFETPYLSDKEFMHPNMLDLSMLTCRGYDQYGEAWNIQNLVYEVKGDSDHVWINPDNGQVTIDAPGTYEFAVLADGVESNTVAVTVYQTYPLTWQETEHGSILVTDDEGNGYLTGNRVREGSVLYVSVVPEDGYECKGLYLDGQAIASGSSFTMTKATEIQAAFDKIITGWQEKDGARYYYDNAGKAVTGWQNIDQHRYYFDDAGRMQLGWKWIGNDWYYFGTDAKDGTMRIGWQKIHNKWYYLSNSQSDGAMKTGWQKINNKWYYLSSSKSDGAMKIGWQKINNKWYYLSNSQNDGSMKVGWQKINNKWYYLSNSQNDGAMKIGWQKINNYWYYLSNSQNDGAMKVGWQNIGGKRFYFAKTKAPVGHWIKG